MPTARYRFTRASGVTGFLSANRASTDALNALIVWSTRQPGRSYVKTLDEDDLLEADLTWHESDDAAGPELDGSCHEVGVTRSFVR